jgi:hypothetical protein
MIIHTCHQNAFGTGCSPLQLKIPFLSVTVCVSLSAGGRRSDRPVGGAVILYPEGGPGFEFLPGCRKSNVP